MTLTLRMCVIGLLPAAAAAAAADLTPGNIVLTTNRQLREYTPAGQLVQSWPVPHPANPDPSYRYTCGVVVTADRDVFVNNLVLASIAPIYVSRLDPRTGGWVHVPYASGGFSTLSDGDMSALGGSLYVNEGRLDPATGALTAVPVVGPLGRSELSPGQDGLLYAVNAGSPQHMITIYDPASNFAVLRQFELRDNQQARLDTRGISALADGTIYAADWNGRLFGFGPTGVLLQQAQTTLGNIDMLKLSADGSQLVVGSWGGFCGVYNTADLGLVSSLSVGSFGVVYADFVPVPDPAGIAALMAGVVVWGRRKRSA